jgi:hypothetical protein
VVTMLTSQRRSQRVIEVGGGDEGRLVVAEDRRSHPNFALIRDTDTRYGYIDMVI